MTFCWSDSEVTLCWIRGKKRSWEPWVENRVVAIRKVVERDAHKANVHHGVE